MKFAILILVVGFQIFSPSMVQAKDEPTEQQLEEYKKKAKFKLYLGGLDEQDLKIQSPLLSVFRKMNPVAEPPPVEDTPSDD